MIMKLSFVLQAFVGCPCGASPCAIASAVSRCNDRLKFVPAPYLGKLKDLTPLAGGAVDPKGVLGDSMAVNWERRVVCV